MLASVCSEFLLYLDRRGQLDVGNSPKAVLKWLDKAKLPLDLDHLLRYDWPQKTAEIVPGRLRLRAAKQIVAQEARNKLLAHGFLEIGRSVCGDPLVVRWDSETCEVGFITHEEFWGQDVDPHTIYARVARSLDSLLYRVVDDRYLPADYYAAKDFASFLADETSDPAAPEGRKAARKTTKSDGANQRRGHVR